MVQHGDVLGLDAVHLEPIGSVAFYFNAGMAMLCVTMAALAAGLTMGMVAIEPFRLQILLATREEDCTSERQRLELVTEKAAAAKILPVISRHHLLLVTLLLLNSIANEALPLFLDEIVPTIAAILLSVTFVLMFGEIIPSAIFTGPNQLFIAARFVPLVRTAIFLLYPIAFPISRVLDKLLGEEHTNRFNKAELRALVKLHAQDRKRKPAQFMNAGDLEAGRLLSRPRPNRMDSNTIKSKLTEIGIDERTAEMAALATAAAQEAIDEEAEDFYNSDGESRTHDGARSPSAFGSPVARVERQPSNRTDAGLDVDEVLIMHGALDLKETTAEDKMIPLSKVYMLGTEEILNMSKLADLIACGHSRVPVYEGVRTNIRGLVLVKKLIVIRPSDERRVDTIFLRLPVFVKREISLLELLNEFQKGHSHMAVVTDSPEVMKASIKSNDPVPKDVNVYGICTLEDIIETLIKEDISDETDFKLSVKHTLFTEQRKRRIFDLALKQQKQRKLTLSGVAALVSAKARSENHAKYGSFSGHEGHASPLEDEESQRTTGSAGPTTPLLDTTSASEF